jgi:endonuclease YncB( thermonuclease family)
MSRLVLCAASVILVATASTATARRPATIAYVVDGDTIAVTSGPHIRLLQIDTPELGSSECYSRRAAKDLRKLLPVGATVTLATDPKLDTIDRYGRLLRYVFRGTLDVNLRLVEQGDATVWFYGGVRGRYSGELLQAARRARAARRGVWGACRTAWNPYGPAITGPRKP